MREIVKEEEQGKTATRFPSVFVSHGAPTLAVEENDTTAFLRELGRKLGKPRGIVCVSAHWNTNEPTVSAAEHPRTIHDFGGFPDELYQIRYPAPGAPALATQVGELLAGAGIVCAVSPDRGLDHGAWVPLRLMYTEADVPVTQLSIQPQLDPRYHFRVGRALAPLRDEGVLLLATGSITHNLSKLTFGGAPPDWARQFDEWLFRKITGGEYDELFDYRRLAPNAQVAHPTDEHLLPLFVALGAGSGVDVSGGGRALHRGWTVGSLSMAAYSFGSDV